MPIGLNLQHKLFIVRNLKHKFQSRSMRGRCTLNNYLEAFVDRFRLLCLHTTLLYNFSISISWINFCFVVTCYLKKHVWIVFAQYSITPDALCTIF